MTEIVRIEGVDVSPAEVVGAQDVFTTGGFELTKPRWVPDQETTACFNCSSPFSSLRRKHHCRQCGRIFCAKCCFEKVILPQFNCPSERVCEQCKSIAQLVAMATSRKLPEKLKGVRDLVKMLDTPPATRKLLECGGVQALVFATLLRDEQLRSTACSGFNVLATHTTLHPYLMRTGVVKSITKILSETNPGNSEVLVAGLSVLSVICKSPQLLPQVLQDGVLEPVLGLVGAGDPTLTQMALRVVGQLVEDPATHPAIIGNKQGALSRIFRCTADADEQTQESALRMLALMALGNDVTRQYIAQEDIFSGHCCQRVLCSRPRNVQVLVNAARLVANMAASDQTQAALKDLLLPLCRLMDDHASHQDLMLHTARGIANFARHQGHAQLLIPYVTNIFRQFVKSVDTSVRYQGLRTMISLMTFFPSQTLVVLQHEDIHVILSGITSHDVLSTAISNGLLRLSPSVAPPGGTGGNTE